MQSPRTRRQTLTRQTLAGYEVVAKIKTGGMAALYLGRKTGAGGFAKHVAIKVILDHMAEDELLISMFLDEARLSARIEHPNVVHIHGLGEEDGKHYLIMEYVAGCSLAQLQRAVMKRSRRLAPAVVAYVGIQVAAGLHAAHETTDDNGDCLHVVHRDVSPKNVLIAYKGYVKLIDFGIAKVRDATQATTAGSLKGTIRYMSPEQASGRNVDRRSDVFSLGIVLWEMLTGRPLFQAENELAALDMVRTATVPAPSHFALVPAALEQVVMRMLAASPEQRFATADDAQRALAMAVPEALGFSPQKLGELVAALLPASPNDSDLDPSLVSALGRPLPIGDPEEVLNRLATPVDGVPSDSVEATSGVSGQVPRGWAGPGAVTPVPPSLPGGHSLVSGALGGPSLVSQATAQLREEAPQRGRPAWVWALPVAVGLLAAAAVAAWSFGGGETAPSGSQDLVVATPLGTTVREATAPGVTAPGATAPEAEHLVPTVGDTQVEPSSAAPSPAAPSADATAASRSVRRAAPRPGRGDREPSAVSSGATAPTPETRPASPREPVRRDRRPTTHVTSDPVISTEF